MSLDKLEKTKAIDGKGGGISDTLTPTNNRRDRTRPTPKLRATRDILYRQATFSRLLLARRDLVPAPRGASSSFLAGADFYSPLYNSVQVNRVFVSRPSSSQVDDAARLSGFGQTAGKNAYSLLC